MKDPVEASLRRVEKALRRLHLACRDLDADGIRGAIDARGAALDRLRSKMTGLDAAAVEAIRSRVADDAREAERALRGAQARIAEDFRSLSQGAHALRGYAVRKIGASALDRSG